MIYPHLNLDVHRLGLIPYDEALQLQRDTVVAREAGQVGDCLQLLEHPHVYTLGRRGSMDNILLSEDELAQRGIAVRWVERGGDVTYHGPGQLVAYPILDLAALRGPLDYPRYVRDLERVLLATVADFGIHAEQVAGYSGIWVAQGGRLDKLAAIGVHVNGRGISSHGIALNVNTDLRYFGYIVPCGISDPDKGVTSMAVLLGQPLDLTSVADRFAYHFADVFGYCVSWPASCLCLLSGLQLTIRIAERRIQMQELIQRLMQEAHLTEGQAQNVLSVAMNFIRSHIPALAPLMGMFGGATTTTTTTSSTAQQGGGLIGDVERMFGGGSNAPTTTTTSATTSTPASGGMPAGVAGALGNLFNGGGPLHQELVQNAGLNQTQAAASTNVIKDFVTQHIPAASSMMQEGSALDNVEDRVDSMFGIKDNNTNPGT